MCLVHSKHRTYRRLIHNIILYHTVTKVNHLFISPLGNGLGIRVVGGKLIPGGRGEIGAYIAKVIPGGTAEQTGRVVEGKVLFLILISCVVS